GQHFTQPAVALGGPARATLAPGHVVAGAAAGPGGQVPGGGEHRHVDADLGNDGLGGPLADPGDGVEAVTGPGERGDDPVDPHVELGDGPLQLLGGVQGPGEGGAAPVAPDVGLGDGPLQLLAVVQGQPHQQGVVGAEATA